MADDIRNRRINTEMENIKKIDSTKIQVERKSNYLDNGSVLSISFNLKDHPYNPRLLKDHTQEMMSMQDAEGEEPQGDDQDEEEVDEPIDELEDKEYTFDLIVPKKFPFVFPELRSRCDFSKPSLMDERDLMEDMLGKQWHPFIILKEIVEKVPQYVYKIKQREKAGTLYYDCNANYNLNNYYDLLSFKNNLDVWKPFACNITTGEELAVARKKKKTEELKRLQEEAKQNRQGTQVNQDVIENVDDERFKKYLVIVSDNSLLLFERPPYEDKKEEDQGETHLDIEPSDYKFTMGKLILWGTITSIEQLKRNMEFKDKISIVWSKPVKNEDDFQFEYEGEDEKELEDELDLIYETTIEVPNSDDFMIVVLDKMNAIKENTNELKRHHILSGDVTSDSVKAKNIKALLHKISVFEKEFESNQDAQFAQDLMELYRKAIEYYSAIGDDQYKTYLDKNSELVAKLQDGQAQS